MSALPCEAVILKRREQGEQDVWLSLLTDRFGRMSVMARSALKSRRRFGTSLNPLTRIRAQIRVTPHSTLAFLEESVSVHAWGALSRELNRIAAGCYLAELTEAVLPERTPVLPSYRLLVSGLERLDQGDTPAAVTRWYEYQLLKGLGLQPVLDRCVRCNHPVQAEESYHFIAGDGGLVCVACSGLSRGRAEPGALWTRLESLVSGNLPPENSAPREVGRVLTGFVEYQLDRPLKTLRFRDSLRTLSQASERVRVPSIA